MNEIPDLVVVEGPLKDRRFTVTAAGMRLGRSSTCEISIKDPALSRNHCLFEVRDGALWLTDLASANGTLVNDELLGADSRRLAPGDRISVGESLLVVGDVVVLEPKAETKVDLGLGAEQAPETAAEEAKGAPMRLVLWAAAALAVAGAAFLIVSSDEVAGVSPQALVDDGGKPTVRSFAYEKVEADAKGIYRYVLTLNEEGVLAVAYDDVPSENRHVRKDAKLSPEAVAALNAIFDVEELYALAPDYTGAALPNTHKSYSLRVIRGGRVFATVVENETEPNVFREVREKLETFSKNELGIWAIQYSADKLLEMSAEARRVGDAKWNERDVQYGNLSAACSAYKEAMFYLETVNPKPVDYAELVQRRRESEAELDKRYRDQRFLADRAINLSDWETARRELRVLCELVPDAKDPRHAEAAGKLMDVETRQKKGDRK